MANARTIGIVDDDDALRDSLALILRFRNFDVLEFESGEALLALEPLPRMDCMILDLRMKEKGGLDVLDTCRSRGITTPIIMVTAFGNVSSARQALKSGAFDFLEKPVHEEQMLTVIEEALSQFDEVSARQAERQNVEERMASLTGRERQVLEAVLQGQHNREIAADFGLSVRTIEVYKARVMEKMRVSRIAELVKLFAHMDPPLALRM
ncbi:MAG: response regulator [Rhodospirillaceae bacterium]|nr:response regulator [Rhodospirillaceae bacterium]